MSCAVFFYYYFFLLQVDFVCVCVSNLLQGQVKLEKALALYFNLLRMYLYDFPLGPCKLVFLQLSRNSPPLEFYSPAFCLQPFSPRSPIYLQWHYHNVKFVLLPSTKISSKTSYQYNCEHNNVLPVVAFPEFSAWYSRRQKKKKSILNTKCT